MRNKHRDFEAIHFIHNVLMYNSKCRDLNITCEVERIPINLGNGRHTFITGKRTAEIIFWHDTYQCSIFACETDNILCIAENYTDYISFNMEYSYMTVDNINLFLKELE